MRDLEKTLKAVGDRNRLRIVKMLERRPMCVCELRAVLGLAQPSVSKHLKILRDAGLIADQQDGLWTNYRICPENEYAKLLLKCLKGWLGGDEQIAGDRRAARGVKKETLCKK
jgi:ArsR family transcriptional regulator